MIKRRSLGCLAAATLTLGSATGAEALTIKLKNLGGVEQGTDAYRGFKVAAFFWESVLTDDVSMNLNVGFNANFGPSLLGVTVSNVGYTTQADWRAALTADATTQLDAIAVANLPEFSSQNVQLTTAVQKALGTFTGKPTTFDGIIRFNNGLPFDFDTRDGFQSVASDFVAVAVHEIGHALGFRGSVLESSTPDSTPSNNDLFRYQNGAWDNSWGGNPYFSIDGGANPLFGNSYFATGEDGEQTYHWAEGDAIRNPDNCTQLLAPQIGIMDPSNGVCQLGIVTANDLALLDALGWDVNIDLLTNSGWSMSTAQMMARFAGSVPEPATWAMMILGFGAIGAAMRRRPRVAVRFA